MAREKVRPKAKDKGKDKPQPKAEPTPESRNKPEQMSLETAAPAAETAAPQAAPGAGEVIVELLQNRKGYWKLLASGEGIAIGEKEWQQELSRLLSRRATPANDSGDGTKS
jgi:hypothetical protein